MAVPDIHEPLIPSMCRRDLEPLVRNAWDAYDQAPVPCRLTPAAPILFFGDLDAYLKSPIRVLTVALNPSSSEFPEINPYERFPGLEDPNLARKSHNYLDALSCYFKIKPYTRWFSRLEPILRGFDASYFTDGGESTALHTDLCSPVPTNPKWGAIREYHSDLQKLGEPLWHSLIGVIRPHVVLISIARPHLNRMDPNKLSNWEVICSFDLSTKEGKNKIYNVQATWHEAENFKSLFVFGQAARQPFVPLTNEQKLSIGQVAWEKIQNEF